MKIGQNTAFVMTHSCLFGLDHISFASYWWVCTLSHSVLGPKNWKEMEHSSPSLKPTADWILAPLIASLRCKASSSPRVLVPVSWIVNLGASSLLRGTLFPVIPTFLFS